MLKFLFRSGGIETEKRETDSEKNLAKFDGEDVQVCRMGAVALSEVRAAAAMRASGVHRRQHRAATVVLGGHAAESDGRRQHSGGHRCVGRPCSGVRRQASAFGRPCCRLGCACVQRVSCAARAHAPMVVVGHGGAGRWQHSTHRAEEGPEAETEATQAAGKRGKGAEGLQRGERIVPLTKTREERG